MSRFVYVLLVWGVLLGGLQGFLRLRGHAPKTLVAERETATGAYRLEVTLTFAVEPDPFALVTDANDRPPALVIQLQGQDILRVTDRLEAGRPLVVTSVPGLKSGVNEFLVAAYPPQEEAWSANALRLRVLQDQRVLADHTVWSIPPEPILATMVVDIPAAAQSEEDHHDR